MTAMWLRIGAISGFLAVACGAFGAHGLKAQLSPDQMTVFQTGVQYHAMHALALVGVGLAGGLASKRTLRCAGWAFLLGTLLFSGTLYALAVSGQRWLGMITPLGGVAFLIGWAALALGATAHGGRMATDRSPE